MAIKAVRDLSYGSGSGPAAGGSAKPYIAGPYVEPDRKEVLDVTASAPAAAGKLLVVKLSGATLPTGNSYTGDAFYAQSATANAQLQEYARGVVEAAAQAQTTALGYPMAMIVYRGPVQAYCTSTANTNQAIAAGTLLAADGAGNLTTAPASPTPGQVIAVAAGALAGGTSTPTLVPVIMGNL